MPARPCNIVYIATSLDGYIAGRDDDMSWLPQQIDEAEAGDFGFSEFLDGIDAIVMGRRTLEAVADFDPWPYTKPLFVLSRNMRKPPAHLKGKVHCTSGSPRSIVQDLNRRGYARLYIDGGETIRHFLERDMIDRMIITQVPVLLGGGVPLFAELERPLNFLHREWRSLAGGLMMSIYDRDRDA